MAIVISAEEAIEKIRDVVRRYTAPVGISKYDALVEIIGIVEQRQPDDDAGNGKAARSVAWADAQKVADIPAVDEALEAFSNDSTRDNAIAVVQAVIAARALLPTPSVVERVQAAIDAVDFKDVSGVSAREYCKAGARRVIAAVNAALAASAAPQRVAVPTQEPELAALNDAPAQPSRRWPAVSGVGRDAVLARSVILYLGAEPTDDELIAIHMALIDRADEATPSGGQHERL